MSAGRFMLFGVLGWMVMNKIAKGDGHVSLADLKRMVAADTCKLAF